MPALFDRKSGNCLILAMLMAFGLGTSCSDENLVNDMQGKEQLSFGVSISDKWNTGGTRSANDEETVSSTKIENSDLWLITTVEDNPDTTLFMQPEEETRATPYSPTTSDGSNDSRLKNFGVYAWIYTGVDWENAQNKQLYINGDKVEPSESGNLWSTEYARFWPGETYRMKFFAYAPYEYEDDEKDNNSRDISVNDDGTPVITYTTNLDAREQQDLLATTKMTDPNDPDKEIEAEVSGNYNQPLPLRFHHILTAVNVKASDPLGRTIKSIKFTGVHASGTYTYGTEWQTTDGANNVISCVMDEGVDLSGSTPDNPKEVIYDDNGTTFMMIPQMLKENAKIVVEFTEGDPLSASLDGKEWPIGKRVTYIISKLGIKGVIETSVTSETSLTGTIEFGYQGEKKTFEIDSYVTDGTNKIAAAWEAEYIREDGTVIKKEASDYPDWIIDFPSGGEGSTKLVTYEIGTSQQILNNSSNKWLRHEAGTKGTPEEPYDLSTNGGSTGISTANCYIVNGPGTYSFPVVYGNALVDGTINQAAYMSSYNNSNVLANFVRHDGQGISEPWIDEDGCTPSSAKLIWQDVQDLVTNIELKVINSEHYISFDVNQKTIQQGNAIIAVLQGSTVLWSWHIWVTDYVPGANVGTGNYERGNMPKQLMTDRTVETADGRRTYTFMGPPLGWCYGGTYPERKAKVRIKQKITGEEKVITIIQKAFTIGNNAPTYQWGRKDPMLPGNEIDVSGNKYYYNSDGKCSKELNTGTDWNTGKTNIKMGIQNPGEYCLAHGMDETYVNLWDMKTKLGYDIYVTNSTSKTIYDPSPVGYKVPSNDAFSGFTLDGGDMNNDPEWGEPFQLSKCNTPYTQLDNRGWSIEYNTNDGWVFYCKRMTEDGKDENGAVIYFPIVNSRSSGSKYFWGPSLLYWEAHSHESTLTAALVAHIESGFFWRKELGYNRGHGFAVRPVRETDPRWN